MSNDKFYFRSYKNHLNVNKIEIQMCKIEIYLCKIWIRKSIIDFPFHEFHLYRVKLYFIIVKLILTNVIYNFTSLKKILMLINLLSVMWNLVSFSLKRPVKSIVIKIPVNWNIFTCILTDKACAIFQKNT